MVSIHGDEVREKYAAVRAAQTDALLTFGQFDREGGWEIEGAASPVSWLAVNARLTRTEAARQVAAARILTEHPEVSTALTEGAIAPSHVAQLTALARHRSQQFRESVPTLIDAARRLSPEHYRTVAAHWRSRADDLLPAEERDEPNSLDFAQTFAGTWVLRGVFDPVRGAAINQIILERAAPTGVADPRHAPERRADALFAALTGDQPVQPRVDVIVDADTLVGIQRPIEDVRCELQGVGVITRVVMERMACNAHVGRVLVRGESEILDLGRHVRLASSAQRRAVIARDRGCVWPHCHRPAAMCEVHHVIPWQQGGPSDLDNLALLCGRHHSRVHHGWKLHGHPDGTWDAIPP